MLRDAPVRQDERFNQWAAEYRGIFVKVASAYTSDGRDREDLLQEMLLQVWTSLSSFRGDAQPSTWIYRVCLNTALNWHRSERRHRDRVIVTDVPPDALSSDPRPGADQEQSELLARLYAAIRRLPLADRSLVLLALDGLTYAEIGAVTGMTDNHVGVALSRARAKLTQQLEEISHELA